MSNSMSAMSNWNMMIDDVEHGDEEDYDEK